MESAQTLSERRKLHVYLEQKAELAVQGECAAQKRFSEGDEDMEVRNSEHKNSDVAFYETNQELESQRLVLYHANQWADDQAQREKMKLCGELEMKIDSSKRIMQEIAEKLKN